MKFAHLSDIHIGSWRDPKLRDISTRAFCKAMDQCIEENVDFILISGDFFNTALPSVDLLKQTVTKLKHVRKKGIPIYLIPGSHDFSNSGKTMLDVLEQAELFVNVVKGESDGDRLKLNFTVDQKTGAKIVGLLGKKGGLEREYYANLVRDNLEQEPGYKIFLFHTGIEEFKPKGLEQMEATPLSFLPRNFNYYAGGHIHSVSQHTIKGYGPITYPGPLFPCNFKELEKLGKGGFYIVEDDVIAWHPIQIYNTLHITIDADHKKPGQIADELFAMTKDKEFINTIVTLRIEGTLAEGKPSDIDFKEIFARLYGQGAYYVMKNTVKLTSREFEEINVEQRSVEEIEQNVIREHLGKTTGMTAQQEEALVKSLMETLDHEKAEGERVVEFEERVKALGLKTLEQATK